MPSNLLASASADVKVWDLQTGIESTKLKGKATTSSVPEQLFGVEVASFTVADLSTAVNAVRWSHDSQYLAVAGNEGNLTIHDSQGKLLETIPLNDEGSDIPDINAVRFANKSRYVMYGGSDKIVNIWDRKESTFTESLKGHRSTITCIDLNVDETIVASSSISGQILVHNRQKSNAWDNLTVLTKQSINALEYSFFKRGLLAAGGEDGSLRLWDTCVSSTALQTFESAHYSEIKGIAFSPFNSHLMCSGGLDKRIVLYDVGKKTTLKSIHTDTPLTALGFKADGVTVAAGTLQGNILIYDLRAASKPMCTLYGHEPNSVKCLHFQEKDRSTDRRNTIVKKQSHFRTSSRGSTPPTSSKISRPSPPPQTPNDTKEKNYMDMFSPVREESKISRPSPPPQTPNDIKEKNCIDIFSTVREESKISRLPQTPNDKKEKNCTDVFSQVREESKISRLPQTPNDTKEKNFMDMFSPVREESKISRPSPPPQTSNDIKEKNSMDIFSPVGEEMVESPNYLTNHSFLPVREEMVDNFTNHTFSSVREEMVESQNNHTFLSVRDEMVESQNNHTFSSVGEEMVESQNNEMTTDFQLQVIRNAVDECLQEFRTSLRNDIQNMHLELLRQFHIQKTEMEMMFLKYCGETLSLREEVERLREENQRLKARVATQNFF